MLVAPVIAVACRGVPLRVESVDLVAAGRLAAEGRRIVASESFCADETWVAAELMPGVKTTADIEFQREPVLGLAGAVSCAGPRARMEEGTLQVEVEIDNSTRTLDAIPISTSQGWWQKQINLAEFSGKPVALGFEVRLPEDCSLLLREATVHQLVPSGQTVEQAPMQILLISVDTLRRDSAGKVFGGEGETPHLDRFAAEAEVWTAHYAAASWTKPSHATMLTGYDPETHRAQLLNQAMDPAIPTLADRFRLAGFSTSALVYDCGWMSPRWGFAKGFDSYRVHRWRAGRQARATANWVLEHVNEPFFFFLHTFEPHSDRFVLPYEAPGINRRTIADTYGVVGFGCRQNLCASGFLRGLADGELPLRARDVEILRDTYDAGVRYVDEALGNLFDALRRSGVWNQLLIVVTSDHGEGFMEHGSLGHSTLHDEIVRVPLVIKWPGGDRGGVVNRSQSASVDLAPTLLEFARLPIAGLPGTPLHRREVDAPVFSGTIDRAVALDGYKAIFDYPEGVGQLFRLVDDPGETVDLAGLDPDRLRRLEELVRSRKRASLALYRRIGSGSDGGEVELGPRERERLEAFGYLQ